MYIVKVEYRYRSIDSEQAERDLIFCCQASCQLLYLKARRQTRWRRTIIGNSGIGAEENLKTVQAMLMEKASWNGEV